MTTLTTIAGGEGSRIVERRRMIVRDAGAWRALWAMHAGPETQTPDVNFGTHVVAAAFAGERPSAGFEIEITGAREFDGAMEIVVEERSPPPGTMAAQMIVTPFHIVSLPRPDGDVRFADGEAHSGRVAYPAMPPRHGSSRPRTPSSTGLSPRTAAGLAYLAGPFSGILVLLAERSNRFVRFHAYQSILALGSLGLLALVFLISAFAALLISPWAFTMMYWLAFATAIFWLAVWALCLFQAFKGRGFKLPLIGSVAARRAGVAHSSH
jgi:uncharacterized membrane protein